MALARNFVLSAALLLAMSSFAPAADNTRGEMIPETPPQPTGGK
jgi:hypothetical protein